jgi:fatty-acyl-CoA synthase
VSPAPEFIELDWLKQWARYAPASIAFKDAERVGHDYSYASLYFLSCRIAEKLRAKFDVVKGQRVAVLATNEIEYVALFFALQRLGAVMVPVNFRLTAREIAHVLNDSGASLVIHQEQFRDVLDKVPDGNAPEKRWSFDADGGLASFAATELAAYRAAGGDEKIRTGQPLWAHAFAGEFDSPCMILYTSGTTGAAKGAVVTNKMLHWNSINTGLRLNLTQKDAALSFLPFFHTGGWNVLVTPFVHRGARTILLKKFDAAKVLELCESERVTVLFGVPTTMDMIARETNFKKADLSTVRYAVVGGEPMPIELIKIWQDKGVPVRQGYGLTEFGPNVFSLNEEDSIRKIGSIGFPNFNIETRVVDSDGHDVPVGEIGELILRGPVCTPGYWNNPEATASAIRDGWLHTGDLVRRDEDGYFYVAGRKKDMFISGGENVYPVEIERYLSSHPAIGEVAVVGVPDPKWGEVGKAYIALKVGQSLSADDVLTYCSGNLAKYKIPRHVQFLPELPKGDSGKILKRKLTEQLHR